MLNFLKKIIHGKEFRINISRLMELKEIKTLLNSMPHYIIDECILKGAEAQMVASKLRVQQRWTKTNIKENNIVLPKKVAEFFLKGDSLKELDSYNCVLTHGMLHGEKRRLVIY